MQLSISPRNTEAPREISDWQTLLVFSLFSVFASPTQPGNARMCRQAILYLLDTFVFGEGTSERFPSTSTRNAPPLELLGKPRTRFQTLRWGYCFPLMALLGLLASQLLPAASSVLFLITHLFLDSSCCAVAAGGGYSTEMGS